LNPPPNGIKFFASAEILESAKNRHWLMKITATINQHWQKKNQRKQRTQLGTLPPEALEAQTIIRALPQME